MSIQAAGHIAHANGMKKARKEGTFLTGYRHRKTLADALSDAGKGNNMPRKKRGEAIAKKYGGVYARTPGQADWHIGSIFKK